MPYTSSQRKGQLVLRALQGSRVTFFYQTTDLEILWLENAPPGWAMEDFVGKTDADLFAPEVANATTAAKREAVERRERRTIDVPMRGEHDVLWFETQIEPDIREDGSVAGIICAAIDITEKKRRETILKSLLREVSHRSKNLLAIILSVASQTARASGDKEDFVRRFVGRIQSIARSQDLITDSNWRGASLFELVDQQVFKRFEGAAEQIELSGDDVELVPNASVHIGLALHELATNSFAFGALSRAGGRVHIVSTLQHNGNGTAAKLVWEETGGPQLPLQYERQFGTTTLERIVPASLNGSGRLDLAGYGARYELEYGANNIQEDSAD